MPFPEKSKKHVEILIQNMTVRFLFLLLRTAVPATTAIFQTVILRHTYQEQMIYSKINHHPSK